MEELSKTPELKRENDIDGACAMYRGEWRLGRDPPPEAYAYLELAKLDLTPGNMGAIQEQGEALARVAGGLRKAPREVQEINHRTPMMGRIRRGIDAKNTCFQPRQTSFPISSE